MEIIQNLLEDPNKFINTLYSEKKSFFSRVNTYSPYFKLNNDEIICPLVSQGNCPRGAKVTQINKNSYTLVINKEIYLLQTLKINGLGIMGSYEPYTKLSILGVYREPMNECLFGEIKDKTLYIGSDEYTNNLLINNFLNYIYGRIPSKAGIKGILQLKDSTISDGVIGTSRLGINVYENSMQLFDFLRVPSNFNYFENRDITEFGGKSVRMRILNRKFIIDLFVQLLINLQLLQEKFEFNHGNLKSDIIMVKNEKVSIEYSTIRHTSDITFKITDFRHSSMSISDEKSKNNLRLFNYNNLAVAYLKVVPFKPVIDKDLNDVYYVIDNFLNAQTLAQIRHMGIQYYPSFDTITLIISLLMIPEIWYSIFSDQVLKSLIWDSLWHPKDTSEIYNRLSKMVIEEKNGTYENILDVLKGTWIKCKLTEQLIYKLSDVRNFK